MTNKAQADSPMMRRVVSFLAPLLLLCSGLSIAGAATHNAPIVFAGGVVMEPLPTSSCKALYYKATKLTTLDCLDTGVYRLGARRYGAAYRWRWASTTGKPAVPEDGSFSINLGNGNLFLKMKGIARPVGKVTTLAGTQKTTGTWRYSGGTGAYRSRSGSGTYVFLVKRNATTYVFLAVSLKGTIR